MDFIFGGAQLPAAVQAAPASITLQLLDERLAKLVSLAPGFSFAKLEIVRNRVLRTSVSRDELERSLQAAMALRLQEYDRESSVRPIDLKWLAGRKQRHQLKLVDRRTRPLDDRRPLRAEALAPPAARRNRRRSPSPSSEEDDDRSQSSDRSVRRRMDAL